MYGQHVQESTDQPGMVTNYARNLLKKETIFSLSPFVPDNFVTEDEFGRPVPRQLS